MRWSSGSRLSRRSMQKSWTRYSTGQRPKPPPQPPRQLPKTPSPPRLIVAGRGNLGRSLARALRAAGHKVRTVSARTGLPALARALRSQRSAIVFLTVPDSLVEEVATRLAVAGATIPRSVAFVHSSGALELGSLASLGRRHPVGSF